MVEEEAKEVEEGLMGPVRSKNGPEMLKRGPEIEEVANYRTRRLAN